MYFEDRSDAARRLADALWQHSGSHPLVLAVPRGAVPMGRVIADELGGELDVVLVRKLGSPRSDEVAVGAVDENGWTYVSDTANAMGVDERYLEAEKRRQLELLRHRRAAYTPGRSGLDPKGRTCIVVDDGVATGATMTAALQSVRARQAAKVICAVPVAPREALARIQPLACEIVCLATPPEFHAVGEFYRDFRDVSDDEVVAHLEK